MAEKDITKNINHAVEKQADVTAAADGGTALPGGMVVPTVQVDKDGKPIDMAAPAAAQGVKTDAPVGDNTTAEGATARSMISLSKRQVNLLIAVLAILTTMAGYLLTQQGYQQTISGTVTSGMMRAVEEPDLGMGVYSTTKNDFTAAINNGAKTATITWSTTKPEVNPIPFTLTAKNVRRAQLVSSAGARTELPVTNVSVSSLTITFGDAAANFETGQTIDIWLQGPDKVVRDFYIYDSGDIDIVAGGVTGSVDLAGLIDGRNYKTIEISANMVDNANFEYAAATDNFVQLNAKGRSLAGSADGKILAAMLSGAGKKAFGSKWNKDAWGSATARNQYIDSSDTAPYHVTFGVFKDMTITYAFKGNGATTVKARFYVKFSN
ncbi:MAG TPA: hypothetical protein PLV42_06965 [bacterium]|nr:hypothetical protein [bacterium]